MLARSGDIVSFTGDLVKTVITGFLALVLMIVISVYMLVYGHQIGAGVRRVMPPGDGTPEDDFPRRVERAVAGYIRGQFLFSLIMGASAAVVLWILGAIGVFEAGKTYAVFFGVFYGLMELVPFIGPILGAAPAVLVALFEDPLTAVWVVIAFVALQQLEGHVVGAQRLRPGPAHQPADRDLRPAVRRRALRDHRRARVAPGGRDAARDDHLPARAPAAGAVAGATVGVPPGLLESETAPLQLDDGDDGRGEAEDHDEDLHPDPETGSSPTDSDESAAAARRARVRPPTR